MLKDERNGDFFLSARICVCVWCVCMCVSLCSLRVWPPLGESAVFPLLLILKAFQTSLGADSQGKTPLKGERAVRSPDFSVCSCSRKAGEGPPPPLFLKASFQPVSFRKHSLGRCLSTASSNSPRLTEEVAAAACVEGRWAEQSRGVCGLEGSWGAGGEPGVGGALRWPRGGDRPPQSQGGRGEKRSTVHPGLPVLPRPLPSSVTGLRVSEGCLVGSGCHGAMFPSGCRKQVSHAEPAPHLSPPLSPPGAEPSPPPLPRGPVSRQAHSSQQTCLSPQASQSSRALAPLDSPSRPGPQSLLFTDLSSSPHSHQPVVQGKHPVQKHPVCLW